VAAKHDVLDLDVEDRELDNREHADVGRANDIGDVAVGEDLTRLYSQNRGLGHAGIRAA
jgi:hypothetical protein